MKNKIRNISIIIGLGILISLRLNVACTGLQTAHSVEESASDINIPSQYSGVISSEAGADVHVILHLEAGRFTEARREAGNFDPFAAVNGTWSTRGDTLLLSDSDGGMYAAFLAKGDKSEELEPIFENHDEADHNRFELRKMQEFDSVSEHFERLRDSGVRFFSSGNEPFWSFRVTGEDAGEFSTPEITIETPVHWESEEADSDPSTGTFISGEEELRVRVEGNLCQDSMSGVLFTHTVYIYFNGMDLTGCGTSL